MQPDQKPPFTKFEKRSFIASAALALILSLLALAWSLDNAQDRIEQLQHQCGVPDAHR